MAPSSVALIILEEGGFVMHDQDKAKATDGTRDWEPIWAWEFCPIVVPLMESLLMSHPMSDECLPVFYHICPLVPIKIHPVFQFPISPPKFLKPMECRFDGNGRLRNPLLCKNGLHLWTCNNLGNVLGLQKKPLNLHYHLCLDLLCKVFVIKDCPSFPIQLVEGEVP